MSLVLDGFDILSLTPSAAFVNTGDISLLVAHPTPLTDDERGDLVFDHWGCQMSNCKVERMYEAIFGGSLFKKGYSLEAHGTCLPKPIKLQRPG